MDDFNKRPVAKVTAELFDNKESAEQAYKKALDLGYRPEDINILMSEDTRKKYFDPPLVDEELSQPSIAVAIGSAVGGAVGGTIGALAAIGTSIAFPQLGIVIAGPLTSTLASIGAGSVSGGLIGALIGWGLPEENAQTYESGIKSGGIILSVNENPETSRLEKEWNKCKRQKNIH